jgi:hypothetical protein
VAVWEPRQASAPTSPAVSLPRSTTPQLRRVEPRFADGALEFDPKAATANFRGSGQVSMRKTAQNGFTLFADRLGSLTNQAGPRRRS